MRAAEGREMVLEKLPFTTVEEAIAYGNRKRSVTQETGFAPARIPVQPAGMADRELQGQTPEPLDFTLLLKKRDGNQDQADVVNGMPGEPAGEKERAGLQNFREKSRETGRSRGKNIIPSDTQQRGKKGPEERKTGGSQFLKKQEIHIERAKERNREKKEKDPGRGKPEEADRKAALQVAVPVKEVSLKEVQKVTDTPDHSTKRQITKEEYRESNVVISRGRAGSIKSMIADADRILQAGKMLMRAARITHAYGREIRFETGDGSLHIRKEGGETFAYLNGSKASMKEAETFMSKMADDIGPEQIKRLTKVLEAAEANPGISVEKAAGDYLPAEKSLSEARNTMPDKA